MQIHRSEALAGAMEMYVNAERNSMSNFSFRNELTCQPVELFPLGRDIRLQRARVIDYRASASINRVLIATRNYSLLRETEQT